MKDRMRSGSVILFSFSLLYLALQGCSRHRAGVPLDGLLPSSEVRMLVYEIHDSIGCHATEVWRTDRTQSEYIGDVSFMDRCFDDLQLLEQGFSSGHHLNEYESRLDRRNGLWVLKVSGEPIWEVERNAWEQGGGAWDWSPETYGFQSMDGVSGECNLIQHEGAGKICGTGDLKAYCEWEVNCSEGRVGGYARTLQISFSRQYGLVSRAYRLVGPRDDVVHKEDYNLVLATIKDSSQHEPMH
jgi:hypothetical protein